MEPDAVGLRRLQSSTDVAGSDPCTKAVATRSHGGCRATGHSLSGRRGWRVHDLDRNALYLKFLSGIRVTAWSCVGCCFSHRST